MFGKWKSRIFAAKSFYMEREALSELRRWRARGSRKPLIVGGARQTGKTWLMRHFAQSDYADWTYINMEDDPQMASLFAGDFDISRIVSAISLRTGRPIPAGSLLILDEIQAAPRAITALKYFAEKAPELHVIAAGSLLGVAMHRGDSFPVGKVDFLRLRPMTFREVLAAAGHSAWAEAIEAGRWDEVAAVADRLTDMLRTYYFTGGMPEAVSEWLRTGDFAEVRRIQTAILNSYENDFSKYAPVADTPRIRLVWRSITGQLAKENRKFVYGMLRQGARAKDFELAIEWLRDAGLIVKVPRVKSGEAPLAAFEDFGAFKIYMLDIGLMCAINSLPPEAMLAGTELLRTFRGALTEQYVAQQLEGQCDYLGYWSADNSRGEIDFLAQCRARVVPIEVKAEENLRSKSLAAFVGRYPALHGLRFSMSPYRDQEWMTNIPLYAAGIAEI